jgi:hypothetical protein
MRPNFQVNIGMLSICLVEQITKMPFMEVDQVKELTNVYAKMRVDKYVQIPEWLTVSLHEERTSNRGTSIQNRKSDQITLEEHTRCSTIVGVKENCNRPGCDRNRHNGSDLNPRIQR